MSDDSESDDWNFKVKKAKTKKQNVEREKRKARIAKQLAQNEEKEEELRNAQDLVQELKKVSIDSSSPVSRKSRTKLAEEMERAGQPSFQDLIAGPIKRLCAFAIDAAVLTGAIYTINLMWVKIEFFALKLLHENDIDQMLAPTTFKLYIMIFLGMCFYTFFQVLPTCLNKKGIGKSVMKISIQSSNDDKSIGFWGIFLREILIKPISIALIIGPILCFFNSEKKTLHDMIVQSVVMND